MIQVQAIFVRAGAESVPNSDTEFAVRGGRSLQGPSGCQTHESQPEEFLNFWISPLPPVLLQTGGNENTNAFWNRFLRMIDTFNLHHSLLRLMTGAPIFLVKSKKSILKIYKLMMKI